MAGEFLAAYNFFKQQGFLPADRNSYSVFREYKSSSILAAKTATLIAIWSFKYNGLYKIISGHLCSVYFFDGKLIYFVVHRPPPGSGECPPGKIVDILYELCMQAKLSFLVIKFVDESQLDDFTNVDGYRVTVKCWDDDSEYVFVPRDLLNLEGGVNVNKRKRLRKCMDDPAVSIVPISGDNIGICREIEAEWCRGRDCAFCESFTGCEKEALEIMISLFDETIYRGLFMYEGNKPIGYIITELADTNIAYLYLGKVNKQNYFVYLLYKITDMYFRDVNFINIDEDLGNTGLRMFKSHLGTYTQWRKYTLYYDKTGETMR
jgi:hypothetical protein